MNPEEFSAMIQDCFGDNLESIVLYGSAARLEHHQTISNFNLLVLIKNSGGGNLLVGQKGLEKWLKKNPPPLIWDLEFFKSSIDVFPLEFLELKSRHKIIWGQPLPLFNVTLDNLRHQCEWELRSKYLRLQNHPAYLLQKPKELFPILLQTLPSIMALMKGTLILLKKMPEENWRKRVEQMAQLTDIHPDIFLKLIDMREKRLPMPRKEEVWPIFEAFLTELKSIIRFVDRLEDL